jgi:hypothetical protein
MSFTPLVKLASELDFRLRADGVWVWIPPHEGRVVGLDEMKRIVAILELLDANRHKDRHR